MPVPSVDPLVGQVLDGRYRVISRLGAGASAAVYLAEDDRLGRRVALKVLHPGLAADGSFLRRFQAEARSAAALRHPHIVQVYDWGEDPSGIYVVLEHLAGGSLRQMLDRSGPLDFAQVAALGAQAAQGLAHAHQRGTAHRDIKPANLLFDEDGRLAIADFGLARAMADATWTEPAGVILGTARYSSPEQAAAHPTTTATDVYSLALVLVEALTGAVPFSADTTVATLMARQGRRVEPTPELGPLAGILSAATEPDPSSRPDAAWLAGELAGLSRRLPLPAPLPVAPVDDPPSAELPWAPGTEPETVIGAANRQPGGPGPDATVVGMPARAASDPVPAADPGRLRRRRMGLAGLGLLLVALALWLVLGVFRLAVPSHPVPRLVGRPVAAAEASLVALHFGYRLAPSSFSDTVAAGEVASQSPASGTAKQGTTFVLVPSKGPAPRSVPDLSGLDHDQAAARLSQAGFVARFVSDYSETVPAGTIVSWSPNAGRQAKGATITVTVSSGPRPRTVPDLTGDSYDQAAAALSSLQLGAARSDVYSSTVPAGQVVSTSPPAGATAPRGSTVTVEVSKGPQKVAVPDVSGDSVEQATAALQAVGLNVGSVYGPSRRGTVFASDPAAGSQVDVGSSVDLYTM